MFDRGDKALEPLVVLKRPSRFEHIEPCGFYFMRGGHYRPVFFRFERRKSSCSQRAEPPWYFHSKRRAIDMPRGTCVDTCAPKRTAAVFHLTWKEIIDRAQFLAATRQLSSPILPS